MFEISVLFLASVIYVALQTGPFGVLLAAVLTVVAAHSFRSWLKRREQFQPFRVTVQPLRTFYTINGLASEQQLDAVNTGEQSAQSLNDGFVFTVIRWASGPSPLVYWNELHAITTDVKATVEYEQLNFKNPQGDYCGPLPPELAISTGPEGFRLSVKRSGEEDFTRVAVIPYAAFRSPQFRLGRLKEEHRSELLKVCGWTDTSRHEFGTHEIWHEQFRVNWMEA